MSETAAAEVALAVRLAAAAHEDQRDKSGEAYILHPLRVMLAVSPRSRAAAVLHDVIEDSDASVEGLRAVGISAVSAAAVGLLSRPEDVAYDAFITRLAAADGDAGEIAREVKVADIHDNLGRMTPQLRRERPDLAERYEAALGVLARAAT